MFGILAKALSTVLGLVSISYALPMAVAFWYGEYIGEVDFGIPMVVSALIAVLLWLRGSGKVSFAGGDHPFVIVGCAWVTLCALGAVPLYCCEQYVSVADALFESVSGFTTTGATVIGDVESLPHCINLWRCEMHWLGGMGIVVLTVALLPVLGASGYRLIQAETTGPEKEKLTSRVSDTAKVLWLIYVVLTVSQCLLLRACGMGWFDALCHSFSTLGTGGFSTRNSSIASFSNPAVEWVCTVFMLLAAANFGLYYSLCTRKWSEVWNNSELRGFIIIVMPTIMAITLVEWPHFGAFSTSCRYAAFQVASIVSTTGSMSSDYTTWLPAAQMLLMLMFLVGGCSGSTAGGVKVIRWVVLAKELRNDMLKLMHPHGVFALRLNAAPANPGIVMAVGSCVFVYFVLVFITALAGTFFGQDILTAFTAALTMVGNVGPAFGTLGPAENWGGVPSALKLIYCFAMLAGRLEVYTLLIMVGRSFAFRDPPPSK